MFHAATVEVRAGTHAVRWTQIRVGGEYWLRSRGGNRDIRRGKVLQIGDQVFIFQIFTPKEATIKRSILFLLDPETAHNVAVLAGSAPQPLRMIAGLWELSGSQKSLDSKLGTEFCGMTFKNCLGLAAGFDKVLARKFFRSCNSCYFTECTMYHRYARSRIWICGSWNSNTVATRRQSKTESVSTH